MSSRTTLLASVVASSVLAVSASFGAAIIPGFNSSSLAANDDGSTGLVALGLSGPINFFGNNYSQLYVNNNGNVTFDAALSTFTPFNLLSTSRVIIAPFFGDVDTRGAGSDLTRYGTGTFGGNTAFGVTWAGVGVGYFPAAVDKLNKFQLLLVDRTDTGAGNFDIVFNYDQIQWETGGASGGTNGLGGNSARAGYSNGIAEAFELSGSAVNGAFLDTNLATGLTHNTLNAEGVLGRYIFQVRNGVIVNPPTTGVPDSGSSLLLLSFALAGFIALKRRMS